MKTKLLLSLFLAAGLLTACHKKPVEIKVERIEFAPASYKMFIGDEQGVTVQCYPNTATNLDRLSISNSNSNVAGFEGGKLKARAAGNSLLEARCGEAYASAHVTVYSGYFTKGGNKYGVDQASGYLMMIGESTPQEIQMTLSHREPDGSTQNFWFHLIYTNLGKTIDFMDNMDGTMVSVQKNNNEDGYCIPYAGEDGTPVVKLADWGDTDARLTKGTLRVEDLGSSTYSVEADFALSTGYTFTVNWEGVASMKTE